MSRTLSPPPPPVVGGAECVVARLTGLRAKSVKEGTSMGHGFTRRGLAGALGAVCLLAPLPGFAQTDASTLSMLSALPVASVVVASEAAGASVQASAALSVAGATWVVRAVESTARGTVYLLERLSDGVRVSVEVAGKVAGTASVVVGTVVTVGVIAAGTILSVAGEAIAFLPNEIGRALLYNRRVGG